MPLGTPLLAGPGAIVATMLFVEEVDDWATFAAVALGVILVHLSLWAAMRFSLPILKVIRECGVLLVTRIAGLLLSAIAVQLVADAVRAFSREWSARPTRPGSVSWSPPCPAGPRPAARHARARGRDPARARPGRRGSDPRAGRGAARAVAAGV